MGSQWNVNAEMGGRHEKQVRDEIIFINSQTDLKLFNSTGENYGNKNK